MNRRSCGSIRPILRRNKHLKHGFEMPETLPKLSFFSLEKQYSENMKIIKSIFWLN